MIPPDASAFRIDSGIARADPEEGVVGDLPEMAIGFGEMARISTPGGLLGRLRRGRPGIGRLAQDHFDGLLGIDIVGDRESAEAGSVGGDSRVLCQADAGEQTEPGPVEREGCHSRWRFHLRDSETISMKGDRSCEIINAQRDHAHPGIHRPLQGQRVWASDPRHTAAQPYQKDNDTERIRGGGLFKIDSG
jgi:hypothetical protein